MQEEIRPRRVGNCDVWQLRGDNKMTEQTDKKLMSQCQIISNDRQVPKPTMKKFHACNKKVSNTTWIQRATLLQPATLYRLAQQNRRKTKKSQQM